MLNSGKALIDSGPSQHLDKQNTGLGLDTEDKGQPWHSFIRWQDPGLGIPDRRCYIKCWSLPVGTLVISGVVMELLTGTGLWPVAIFTVIFILLVDLMHRRQRWSSRYPPGPMSWPVLGNLLQVDLHNMPYSLYKVSDLVVDGN